MNSTTIGVSARKRDVIIATLAVAGALSVMDRYLIFLFLNRIATQFHMSDTQIGLLVGAGFTVFYGLFGVIAGKIADEGNRVRLMSGAIAAWSLCTLLTGFASSTLQLILCRTGLAAGESALTPASYSIISELSEKEQVARSVGLLFLGTAIAPGLAMLGGGALLDLYEYASGLVPALASHVADWQFSFIVAAIPGFVLAFWIVLTVPEPRNRPNPTSPNAAPSFAEVLGHVRRHGRFYGYLLGSMILISIYFTGLMSWTPTYIQRRFAWNTSDIGFATGVVLVLGGAAGVLIGDMITRRLARTGHTNAPSRAFFLTATWLVLPAVLMPLVENVCLCLLALGGTVTIMMCVSSLAPGVLQIATPAQFRGRATSFYLIAVAVIAPALGPFMIGLSSDYLTDGSIGAAMAIMALILLPPSVLLARAMSLQPISQHTGEG